MVELTGIRLWCCHDTYHVRLDSLNGKHCLMMFDCFERSDVAVFKCPSCSSRVLVEIG